MQKEYSRNIYLEKLIKAENNGFVKVITGLRRCGKSYLLNTLFYNSLLSQGIDKDHIIRFSFDSVEDLALISSDINKIIKANVSALDFIQYLNKKIIDEKNYYLLLDEIQMLDGFELVLCSYIRHNNIDIYVTGSNAKLLSNDVATEFAGRGYEIHLQSLSFKEYLENYNGNKDDALKEYMLYGGLPIVAIQDTVEDKIKILKNLFDEIYVKDLVKRHNIKNVLELNSLVDVLSSSIGSLTNPERIKTVYKSKIAVTTIGKYIEYLKDSFLIKEAKKYDVKGRKYISSPSKYYFSDLGLRNIRLGFRQNEENHIMENIIYNALILRGFSVDVGVVEINSKNNSSSTTRKQLEIDFVCNLGNKRYYIQSAYNITSEEKKEQEESSLLKIKDGFKKIIIKRDQIAPLYNENGILEISLLDFLLNEKSLDI